MKNKIPASSQASPLEKRRRQNITPKNRGNTVDAFAFPTSPAVPAAAAAATPSQSARTPRAGNQSASEPERYKAPLVVASFLPKGGVAKTTTALGLAGILASQGKRVLLADCDSQCSTTDFVVETFEDQERADELLKLRKDRLKNLVSAGTDSEDETESDASEDENEDNTDVAGDTARVKLPYLPGDKIRATTKFYPSSQILARDQMLSSADAELKTVFEAMEDFCQEGPAGCHLPCLFPYDPDCGDKLKQKIFLLAGDHRLADFVLPKETDAQQQRAMFGLRWILRELCKKHNIDLVIMDMGPGISRVNKMLLHTADVVMPSFRPDYYAWGSYGHLVLDVLPEFLGLWLKEATRALRLIPQGGRKDWAAGLYPQQKDDRNAKLTSPLFLPGLANQYYRPMSSATVNFIVSVQELINPSPHNEEKSVLDESVQNVFMLGEAGQSVVAFMPSMPVFEVSHELGIPATLLTQSKITEEATRMKLKSRKDFSQDLDLIKKRFTALAKWISVLSLQICEHPL